MYVHWWIEYKIEKFFIYRVIVSYKTRGGIGPGSQLRKQKPLKAKHSMFSFQFKPTPRPTHDTEDV